MLFETRSRLVGDSDTLACISGGIAEAYYGPVSLRILNKVKECLPEDLWSIAERFCNKYGTENSRNLFVELGK